MDNTVITEELNMTTTQAQTFRAANQAESLRPTGIPNAVVWTLQALAGALFLFAGTSKLAGVPMMVQMFDAIGIGQWFRYVTGTIEVVGAVLLFVPALALFGALALAATMVGAIITHLFVVGGNPAVSIVLLAATTTIAWARRSR
jgi:putative oxidoreductase